MVTSRYVVVPCVFDLVTARCTPWCIVRVYHIGKASGHCGVLAIDTTAMAAPIAMMLVRVNKFATDLHRCTFVGACQNNT